MAHISEQIISSNHKILSYDQMRKMTVNFVHKKSKTTTTPLANSPFYIFHS